MRSIIYELTPNELQVLLDTSNGYCDVLRKLNLSPHGSNSTTLKKVIKEFNLDETLLNDNRKKYCSTIQRKTPMEDILSNKYTFHSSHNLLKRLIVEGYKEYKCENCGINEWMGLPISLQLEHVDGNHFNNNLNNLKVLCPNCHSQTETFAGRNVDHSNSKRQQRLKHVRTKVLKQPPISRNELKTLIRTLPFTRIGEQFGVTDNSIRKWCIKYKLPSKVSVIKTISDEEWENI